jgi:hypothetical protein
LAALGGVFCSSAISVNAYGKASLYGRQKHEFLHIADKHVNREENAVVGQFDFCSGGPAPAGPPVLNSQGVPALGERRYSKLTQYRKCDAGASS